MDPQKISDLANLLRRNGDKLLNSESTLTLSGSLLRALNDSFTLIADSDIGATQKGFQVVKPINAKSNVFSDLQLLHDFVQKTTLLCIIHYPTDHYFEGAIDIEKFHALKRLEVHKTNINQFIGIQSLRAQLEQLVCVKSINSVEEIITHCGGDSSNGFVWNELKSADFGYNNLRTVDTSLEFAQYLQHLNLRHNKLHSVASIKWLRHLKTLDLSFNCLVHIPQFHLEACKSLQMLNISNNFVEDLIGIDKLDALADLDLSDNCLLEHTQLLPLSALVTLRTLNLYGNPLHCHPKHRWATAQYLHKNSTTVKFLLDLEPLSKSEKSLTGTHKLRYVGSLSRGGRSSSLSINNLGTSTSTTPISSVDSRRSINLHESASDLTKKYALNTQYSKRRGPKMRTVDITEFEENLRTKTSPESSQCDALCNVSKIQDRCSPEYPDSAHLEAKKQVEALREKFGKEWLQSGNAELMQNMLGISITQPSETERQESRQIFNEFLGELSMTSSPTNDILLDTDTIEIKNEALNDRNETSYNSTVSSTMYLLRPSDNEVLLGDEPHGLSSNFSSQKEEISPGFYITQQNKINTLNKNKVKLPLKNILHRISDPEDNEGSYIVYNSSKPSEPLFLTISSNYIREKDTLTERTRAKWSLNILESCERIKSNMLQLIFTTVKQNKRERLYTVENPLCQELENKLRDILSRRNLMDMNMKIYSCVNCRNQFTQELKKQSTLRCPDCGGRYIADVPDVSSSFDKTTKKSSILNESKISPALIVEEFSSKTLMNMQAIEDNKSEGSAISINESSSCSKISNSQCSFDSNQSVVGSTNTDRDLEFRTNESDVDIISNPSQSSIEVLDINSDQAASRKTSEEFIGCPENPSLTDNKGSDNISAAIKTNLTESSSSGSVTDSICTTYEQQATKNCQVASEDPMSEFYAGDTKSSSHERTILDVQKEVDIGLSTRFGALIQSTNMLLSSSKKNTETIAKMEEKFQAYKFNYMDFNDIDHRLKLYFYQQKFEEVDEHLKWLIRGRIYNEQTLTSCIGLVVMSTHKCYLMEAYAPPQDEVLKWLRQLISVTMDRVVQMQLLPWKVGLSFTLRDWGNFLLLLQDIERTNNFLLYLADSRVPSDSLLNSQPSAEIMQRFNAAVGSEKLNMCAVLNECVWTCGNDKRCLDLCTLLSTDTHLFVSVGLQNWLSIGQQPDIVISFTQLMSNLIEVEHSDNNKYVVSFLDETQNKCEKWQLMFETKENADCCLNAIGQSWEKLFGVSLLNT